MATLAPIEFTGKKGSRFIIRSAGPGDAAGVLTTARAVLGETPWVITTPEELTLTEKQEAEWLEKMARGASSLFLVAVTEVADVMDGQVVGILDFNGGARKRIAHTGELGMSVLEQHRGNGIGEALLRTLILWAEAHPTVEKLGLKVHGENVIAQSLYRKLGFVEEGRLSRDFKYGPGKYADSILMSRFVKPAR